MVNILWKCQTVFQSDQIILVKAANSTLNGRDGYCGPGQDLSLGFRLGFSNYHCKLNASPGKIIQMKRLLVS